MISCILHKGSGLGNQLHRIMASKVLALEKGYEWGVIAQDLFKGKDFLKIDLGDEPLCSTSIEFPSGKVIVDSDMKQWQEWNKNVYDPDINFVEDNTIIDGNFEDERYFEHRLPEIKEWLNTEPFDVSDDKCIIGFRGGEYYTVPELGLPKEYYERAIVKMREINPRIRFEVHTDDLEMAKNWFPQFKVLRDIETNWQAVRYAKYAIIANSSFYVLPRLLNGGLTIAPRYFNRYNSKRWDYPQSYYKKFTYI